MNSVKHFVCAKPAAQKVKKKNVYTAFLYSINYMSTSKGE